MTRSPMPQKERVRSASISAPRYTSSASSQVPVRPQRSTMRRIAVSERTDPVGLLGLDRYRSLVAGVTARSNSSQSGSHAASVRSRNVRTLAPRLLATPGICM